MRRLCILAALSACLLWAAPATGEGWKANIAGHPSLPHKFLAVDKASQKLHLYARQSPLKELSSYPCTTGQGNGDKQSMGDLRTPEGVYFVEGRMTRPLDWEMYGNLAYPLNYPNPVDRLKGKTGYGIWIHGRGRNIVPRDTRGCVAMNTPDLKVLGQSLDPGTPVVISSELAVRTDAGAEAGAVRDLEEAVALVNKWARAWETGSEEFFSYYDPKAYSEAGEGDFERFKAQKRSLFERYAWIRVLTHDVRALAGPDYVVTYFRQYYRSPALVSEGISRLYWMRGPKGGLRIVGREWERTGVTLDGAYLERSRAEIAPVIDAWRKAWERADLAGYMKHFAPGAAQGERTGHAIREHKAQLWPVATPRRVVFGTQRYALAPEGIEVTFNQTYAAKGGYEDKGIKTLLMVPHGAGWKILREDWRPL